MIHFSENVGTGSNHMHTQKVLINSYSILFWKIGYTSGNDNCDNDVNNNDGDKNETKKHIDKHTDNYHANG